MADSLTVVLAVDTISKRRGGEAGKTFVYLDKFEQRGINVWLVCHTRVRTELKQELSREQFARTRFISDTKLQYWLWRVGRLLPNRIRDLIVYQLIYLISQLEMKKIVEQLVQDNNVDIVFQPTPNTPLAPSALYDLGVPVVVGPLTGGLDFPPSFTHLDSHLTRKGVKLGQNLAKHLHHWMPGKLKADEILVANEKTSMLLPKGYSGHLHSGILESGVDLEEWNRLKVCDTSDDEVKFVFTGRLVDWKCVDLLLDAFQNVSMKINAVLSIIGDGEEREKLEGKSRSLQIADKVDFLGFMPHSEIKKFLPTQDVFVLPSLRESGGNALLEAMAVGLPVITANWGGPGLIVDSTCGIKVEPESPTAFVAGLAEAMLKLAKDPELRCRLGQASRERIVAARFDWDSKIDYLVNLFEQHRREKGRPDCAARC